MRWSFTKAISLTLLGMLAVVAIAAGPGVAPKLPFEGKDSIPGSLFKIDVMCILRSWRIKGFMVCMHGIKPHVCLRVENAYPSGLIEVVRQPFKSHFLEVGGFLKGLDPLRFFGGSSSHVPVAGDGTTNQYVEARVYTFVPPVPLLEATDIPIVKPWGPFFRVDYISELDGWGWRNPVVDAFTAPESRIASLKSCDRMPDLMNCAGTWGSYYPRIGFVNHPSQVIAAFLQALRAGRAASRPIGRVVLSPYPFEPRTGHYIQMLEPVHRPSVPIGSPLVKAIETGAGSKYGAYLFMHYGIFETCKGCLPVLLTGPRVPW